MCFSEHVLSGDSLPETVKQEDGKRIRECECHEGKVYGDVERYWQVEFLGGCETLRFEDRYRCPPQFGEEAKRGKQDEPQDR
jgi:hypothetical protein